MTVSPIIPLADPAELEAAYERIDELTETLRRAHHALMLRYGDAFHAADIAESIEDVIEPHRVAA